MLTIAGGIILAVFFLILLYAVTFKPLVALWWLLTNIAIAAGLATFVIIVTTGDVMAFWTATVAFVSTWAAHSLYDHLKAKEAKTV